ncbi:enoyl-CoA hydratase-related protein [Polaromonas sp.]|uniref:enoyl-CoA hydratase/isomerase family protein n=1 Tax=Polaromonas sp. TaxID=1869339 RepID=UPI001857AA6A|nr:enoyl-CoA hydratase-related protein [Polaromonas sp.]NMM05636.1 enoyl-CoA hydratase [Polaromonas sp.]
MVPLQQFQFIQYGVVDGLATLAINRPPFNVLDIPTMGELNDALDACQEDSSVKLLVITGIGDKAFSAGVEVADHTPDKVDQMIDAFHGIFRRLHRMSMPIIAVVNGVALGGGMELAIACDMIVAAAGAKFGQPEIKLAVFPPVAAVLLPTLMPPARAMEILLGGENFTSEEGRAMGLVNRVFPRETFAAEVQAFLAPFLKLSRVALLSTRKAIREAAGKPFNAALDTVETIYLQELMMTDDAKEGLAAFLEKRKPVWRNS